MRNYGVLSMHVEERQAAAVVSIEGEIDLATAPDLQQRLIEAGGGHAAVIADFGGVTYFDMSGIRALEAAARSIAEHGGRLAVASPSPLIRRIFDLVGQHLPVGIYDSVEEAVTQSGTSARQ